MKPIGLCIILLYAMPLHGQVVEKFLDIKYKPCEASKARFFAQAEHADSGWVWRSYYLPTKKLREKGLYKDSGCQIKNGWFWAFYPDGIAESAGMYEDGKKQGTWHSWHFNGMPRDSIEYVDDKPVGTALSWHPNGYMSDSAVTSPDGITVTVSWFDNGQLSAAGRINANGDHIGRWQFFHINGKLSADETYDNGKLLTVKYYDENGRPQIDSVKDMPRGFVGGLPAWSQYLGNYLSRTAVANPASISGESAQVTIAFMLDENGKVKYPYVAIPWDDTVNSIALKAIRDSPKWHVAISHNRRVTSTQMQSISLNR